MEVALREAFTAPIIFFVFERSEKVLSEAKLAKNSSLLVEKERRLKMKEDLKEVCKYISWAVRKAHVYASYGEVEADDLWSAKMALLQTLPKISFADRRRLMNFYIDLIYSQNVIDQGLSF